MIEEQTSQRVSPLQQPVGRSKNNQLTEHKCGPERLGRRLRKAREIWGYEAKDLAEAMQISLQELNDRESGKVGMSTLEITRLCRRMSISIPDFFESELYDYAPNAKLTGAQQREENYDK